MQSAGITLPADGRVTALVPSEAAIRQLKPEERAFWLQPRMLPSLVRWGRHCQAVGGGFLEGPSPSLASPQPGRHSPLGVGPVPKVSVSYTNLIP